jgi:hypothetical protein
MKYRRHFRAAFVVAFALQGNALGQRFDDPISLMRITEYEVFQRTVSDIDKASDFRHALLITRLKERLGDEGRLTLRGHSGDADKFDLTTVGGRARWLIEHFLQHETGNANLNVDARIKLWQAAVVQRRSGTEKSVSELKEKYWGTIHSGIVGSLSKTSIEAMDRFLDDWFPYGKRIADLEEITGVRLGREGEEAVVSIDSGYNGCEYRFHLTSGVIESVIIEGIN